MDGDTSLGADLAAAMGDTSTQSTSVEPTPTVATPAQPDAATTAPAGETTAPTTTDESKQGPIPFKVHHTALENARLKAVEEAQAKWDQEYGWAKNANIRAIVDRVARSQGDPIAFFAEQFDELAGHPQFGQQLRSFVGQRLSAFRQRGEQAVPEAPQPDVAIYDNNGQVVGQTYSAEALAKRDAVLKTQWQQEAQQMVAGLRREFSPVIQAYQRAAMNAAADTFSATTMQQAEQWPGMHPEHDKENRAAVGKRIEEIMRTVDPQLAEHEVVGPILLRDALKQAWLDVVAPKLQSQAVRSAVATQEQKATVNTASPQTGSTGTSKSYSDMSWAEAFQHELAARR